MQQVIFVRFLMGLHPERLSTKKRRRGRRVADAFDAEVLKKQQVKCMLIVGALACVV